MSGDSTHAYIGRPLTRVEDITLLRGRGRFVDDMTLPGMLHAAFVRSPVAHARLNGIDTARAKALPGVRAVLTYRELRPLIGFDRIPLALPVAVIRHHVDPSWLAEKELCFVGEPIAIVIAESRAIAEDAANRVALDYEELPPVLDPVAGLEPGAPQARLDFADNLVARWSLAYGDADAAFAGAAHKIAQRFRIHKGGGHAIEARGVLARFDAAEDLLTVWDGTQMPHKAKRVIVDSLGLSETQVRVIAPHVGGGFGPKNPFYAEELVVPAAAMLLGVPIKWVEDRRESFTASNHEREQDWDLEAAVDADGRLLAVRGRVCHDHGSATPSGLSTLQNSRHQFPRTLCAAGVEYRVLRLHDQSRARHVVARRRPSAGHLRHGAAARPYRGSVGHHARRGAPAQSHPRGRVALRHAGKDPRRAANDLRQRRLSGMPGAGAGSGGLE